MSELQIGVLILGGAVIALVYGFNAFQEWRFRKKTRQAFTRGGHDDVLLDVPKNNVRDGVKQDRMEPVLVDAAPEPDDYAAAYFEPQLPPAEPERQEAARPREAVFDAVPVVEEEEEVQQMDSADHQALVVAMLHPSLDFIAEVVFHAPHELAAIPRFNVGKRTQLIGRTEKGLWKPAEALPGTRYKQINVSMQMAPQRRGHRTGTGRLLPAGVAFRRGARRGGQFPQRQQSWWQRANWAVSAPMWTC